MKRVGFDQRGIANSYANLGDFAFEQENYHEAKRYHLLSIQIRDSLQLKEDATQSYTRMGEMALANKDAATAIYWCKRSCDIADQGQYWESGIACHECLYQAYKSLGNWENALSEHGLVAETALQAVVKLGRPGANKYASNRP